MILTECPLEILQICANPFHLSAFLWQNASKNYSAIDTTYPITIVLWILDSKRLPITALS